MTNAPNYAPKPPSGGMPKWLIILLVILLVIILGCCGGVTMCFHYSHQIAEFGAEKAKEQGKKFIAEEQKRMEEAATRQAEELKRQRELALPHNENGSTGTTPLDEAVKNNGGGTSGNSADPALKATKLPATFPDDIPVFSGLVPVFSAGDKTDGSASVIFSGPPGTDAIAAFYEKEMPNNGWKEDDNTTINDAHILKYSKDGRHASISVTNDNDKKTVVTIRSTKN